MDTEQLAEKRSVFALFTGPRNGLSAHDGKARKSVMDDVERPLPVPASQQAQAA